jgi:predicted HicB family RNase H-like nuclease
MDSRISIKADFVSNTPYIDVVYNPSDDSRDEMVKAFAEKLEHTSAWCWIDWQPQNQSGRFNFRVYPLTPEQLQMHIDRMTEALRVYKAHQEQYKQ